MADQKETYVARCIEFINQYIDKSSIYFPWGKFNLLTTDNGKKVFNPKLYTNDQIIRFAHQIKINILCHECDMASNTIRDIQYYHHDIGGDSDDSDCDDSDEIDQVVDEEAEETRKFNDDTYKYIYDRTQVYTCNPNERENDWHSCCHRRYINYLEYKYLQYNNGFSIDSTECPCEFCADGFDYKAGYRIK